MFENKIMYEIIEKIQEGLPVPISICDGSGRVMVSTDPSSIGDMNLLAIKALDVNAKVFSSSDCSFQKSGAAMPLTLHGHRIGAVVVEQTGSPDSHLRNFWPKPSNFFTRKFFCPRNRKTSPRSGTSFSINGCIFSPVTLTIL